MKPSFNCATQFTQRRLQTVLLLGIITTLLITGCSGAAQATPTAQIVTVPVEVTRLVEVINTVEVTRQVLATVIVEVPVTPEATPSITSVSNQPAATLPYRTPTLAYAFETPKAEGSSRLKISNETEDTLNVKISSLRYSNQLELSRGKSAFLNVPYGDYTITVYRDSDRRYSVTVSCVTLHKYEVNLREKDAKVILP